MPDDVIVDPLMQAERAREADTTILTIHGALDARTIGRLAPVLAETLRQRPRRLLIDLSDVSYIGSSALVMLVGAKTRSVRQRVDLALVCNVTSTLELLRLTRLDHEFEVQPSTAAALAPSRSASPDGMDAARVRRSGRDSSVADDRRGSVIRAARATRHD